MTLDLSCDGSRLLVFTVERGAVWLTVLDAASGEQTQRFELFPAAMLGGSRPVSYTHLTLPTN